MLIAFIISGACIAILLLLFFAKREQRPTNAPIERDSTVPEGLPALDLVRLDEAYDRYRASARDVDDEHLQNVIFPALFRGAGVGKDEFERKNFEENRAIRVAEIKDTVIHFRVDNPLGDILVYDFERKCFPVRICLNTGLHSYICCDGYQLDSAISPYHNGEIFVSNVEDAKRIRHSGRFGTALVIAKPLRTEVKGGYWGSGDHTLFIKIMGLRLIPEGGRESLLKGVTS